MASIQRPRLYASTHRLTLSALAAAIWLAMSGGAAAESDHAAARPAAPTAVRPPAASPEPWVELTVVRRDSLIALSRQVLISPRAWRQVARFNRLADPDLLLPGQVLRVPLRMVKTQPAAGRLIDVEGEVRASDAAGVRVMQTGDSLSEGTQLSTGERDSAVLVLADGSRVRLLPNSLAALSASRVVAGRAARGAPAPASMAANAPSSAPTDGAVPLQEAPAAEGWFVGTMRLVRGSMEVLASKVRRAKPLEVETPTTVVGVRGTDYRVGLDDAANDAPAATHVEVLDGRVRVDATARHQGQRASTLLEPGRGVVVNAQGTMQLEPLLPAPDLHGLPPLVEVPLVRFDWPHAAPLRVQVAHHADFRDTVFDAKVPAGEPLRVAGLDDGVWHLRVRQISSLGVEGYDAEHVFTLHARPEPPASQAPRPQSKHAVGPVLFAWAPNAQASSSRLQLARDVDFRQVVEQRDGLAGDSVSLEVAQPGTYFWRLASDRANAGGGVDAGPWGVPQRFEARPLPQAPSGRLSEDGALILSWGEVGGVAQTADQPAVRYIAELARDEQFTQALAHAELSEPQWRIKGPGWHAEPGSISATGTAYFRYRTVESDGYVSPPSAPLKVELPRDPRGAWLLLLAPILSLL